MKPGFSGHPVPYLVPRRPLRSDEPDESVFCGMGGFEFGKEEEMEKRLLEVLEHDDYPHAIEDWEHKQTVDDPGMTP